MRKIRQLPSKDALDSEKLRRDAKELTASFKKFVIAAWPIVEPGSPFLDGVHIDAICDHLQACYERRIKRLLVNVPPRTGKSTIISVLFPAWVWANNPSEKFLFGSYSLQLATRDSVRTRRVVESEWFLKRWPTVVLRGDQNMKTSFENESTGHRQVTAVNSSTTGLGGTFLIMDDPHNVQQAESAIVRESAVTWFREAWSTRANSPDTVRIVVMQRVHQSDVSGYVLEEGGWSHLKLPMRYEVGDKIPTEIGWTDPREGDGELLWPARYNDEEISRLEKTLGGFGTAAQLQQRPVPRGGGTFKVQWVGFWYDEEVGIPEAVPVQRQDGSWTEHRQTPLPKLDFTTAVMSWDMAFKDEADNDYAVGQAWARALKRRADHFLLDQVRGHFSFPATVANVVKLKEKWPDILTILVEEKANGAAAIQTLRNTLPGIIPIDPEGGKISRAAAIAPLIEAGNVWLPHPDQFPWVKDFLSEFGQFPKSAKDDQVDAMSQALIRMQETPVIELDPSIFDAGFRRNPWI